MRQLDNIEKLTTYLDNVSRLHDQINAASEHQKLMLIRMKELMQKGLMKSEEYIQLECQSKALQERIDHFSPILKEELAFIKKLKDKRHQ